MISAEHVSPSHFAYPPTYLCYTCAYTLPPCVCVQHTPCMLAFLWGCQEPFPWHPPYQVRFTSTLAFPPPVPSTFHSIVRPVGVHLPPVACEPLPVLSCCSPASMMWGSEELKAGTEGGGPDVCRLSAGGPNVCRLSAPSPTHCG